MSIDITETTEQTPQTVRDPNTGELKTELKEETPQEEKSEGEQS